MLPSFSFCDKKHSGGFNDFFQSPKLRTLFYTIFDALTDKLISKYGSFYFDIDKDDKIKFGYQWLLFTDLVVTLSVNNKINVYGAKMGEWVFVEYYSRAIMKEMQTAESENIEL